MGARRAREGAAVTQQRLSAFRFPFCFAYPRVIVMIAGSTTGAV
jgi:hypothetical protein